MLSVTVVAPKGSTADALSTALFVMGATDGKRLISRMRGVSAVFIEQRTNGLTITTAGTLRLTHLSRVSH